MEAEILDQSNYDDQVLKSKDTNGDVNHSGDKPVINGFSNGIDEKSNKKEEHRDKQRDKHKDKHRDKDRDKDRHRDKDRERDRDKEKSRDKDRDREKERDREKDKHRDKDKSSSHKSSSRDKDRDKERKDKDRERDKDKEREKEKSRDKDKDKERRDKDRERKEGDKDRREGDKDRKEGDKERRDKDKISSSSSKHNSSSSSRDKERDKHKSSSSSSKDKERSEKDKYRDKDRDKEKHRDKEREKERDKSKHSSSSSKDKERKDKDKYSSDKPRESHSKDGTSSHKDKSYSKEKDSSKSPEKESKPKNKKYLLDDSFEDEVDSSIVKEEVQIKEEIKEEKYTEEDDEGALYIKEEPEDMDQTYDTSFDQSKVKTEEEDSDDDVPLSARATKRQVSEDEDDDMPLSMKKIKKEKESKKKRKKDYESEEEYDEEEEEDYKPKKKKKPSTTPAKKKSETKVKSETSMSESPTKKKKGKEEQQEVWKWWEEEKKDSKTKWNFLEHKGPVFAPPYEPLPKHVKFFYDGKEVKLSEEAEEVATFYARMIEHDYVTKEAFNKNFFKDWRKVMTSKERELITNLSKCNFKPMHAYFTEKAEERKNRTKEEKQALKEENEKLVEEYGFCTIDGHKEKIGNFRLEPPGLFRGRGEHPKMGMLKKRLNAEDIIINCSKDANIPKPPPGHKWKEVRHDNTVTWLASWTENVQGQVKYIMLNPSSKLKGEKDWQKYETARKLHKNIEKIRNDYKEDWKSKEMRIRQRAVALYFIDKLALRAGNEKDEDQADTVGCCSLRVEHIELHPERDGKENVVVFDFLGKDSIRYYNEVPVEKRVFKNLQLFVENKKPGDDLFDRLNTSILNKHLNELMEGLTAKVFRTYNASITLQQQLDLLTDPNYSLPEKILAYNRANRAVAILCNHQRSVPKSHQKSMDNLKEKIAQKKEDVEEAEKQYKSAKREAKNGSAKEKINADKAKKKLERLREQLTKLEVQETDREENKTIALGTSKLNYLDPRISVAWCKKYDIPIDKVYNKTQRSKFNWAIDMAGPDYIF